MAYAALQHLLSRHHPVPLGELESLWQQAAAAVGPDLLALCSAYIDAALHDQPWRPRSLAPPRDITCAN